MSIEEQREQNDALDLAKAELADCFNDRQIHALLVLASFAADNAAKKVMCRHRDDCVFAFDKKTFFKDTVRGVVTILVLVGGAIALAYGFLLKSGGGK